jgi:hypothetical protein
VKAIQGQLRVGPSGHVLGFDFGGVAALMRLKGCENAEVTELVQAAEAAIVASMRKESDE